MDSNSSSSSPWGTNPKSKSSGTAPEKSGEKEIFLFVGIIILCVIGAGVYYFLKPQGANIGFEFSKPSQVLLGDQITVSVSVSNYSDTVLKNSKISLFLPDGVSFIGQAQNQRLTERTSGDLGPGSIHPEDFTVIVTDGANSVKHLEAKIIYSMPENPSNQFEHSGSVDLLIGQPAVGITLTAPQSVFSNQDFDVKVDYTNSTSHEFKNLHLKIDYPPNFQFKQSSVQTEISGNNSWDLGNLPAGSRGTILITGSIVGQEKSFFSFNGSLFTDFSGVTYAVNKQSVNLSISPSPLSLETVLSSGQDYAAHPSDVLNYSINFKNNSDVAIQNINIKTKLIGEMFDFERLQSNGSFDSVANTIFWSPANTPVLSSLAPGESGSVNFHLQTKNIFPVRLMSDKNYTLKVQTQIDSPTIPPNTTANRTISVSSLENKVSGQVVLNSVAYWRDAASGILNTGPYPPKINQPTQYTVHWKLANYATDVSHLVVSAYLQSGARFTGKVSGANGISPTYDPNSGLVSWNIGTVPANKGVVSAPLEAIFQIEVTPAVNQINQNISLLSETNAEGTDLFTGLPVYVTVPQVDSSLPYDKTITVSDRTVKQ